MPGSLCCMPPCAAARFCCMWLCAAACFCCTWCTMPLLCRARMPLGAWSVWRPPKHAPPSRSFACLQYFGSAVVPGTSQLMIVMELMAASAGDVVSPPYCFWRFRLAFNSLLLLNQLADGPLGRGGGACIVMESPWLGVWWVLLLQCFCSINSLAAVLLPLVNTCILH